jgi:class 3 adenylate cyclase
VTLCHSKTRSRRILSSIAYECSDGLGCSPAVIVGGFGRGRLPHSSDATIGMNGVATRYAKTVDGVHIAYQTLGTGPIDLVLVSWLLNVEHIWRWPLAASFLRRLASFSRLILFDRRGTGLSDHAIDEDKLLSLDARMDDIRAVMDAVGSDRAVLLGLEQFGSTSLFAASFPSRTLGLVAYEPRARDAWAPDYPWGYSPDAWNKELDEVERTWGTVEIARSWAQDIWPEALGDEERLAEFATFQRFGGGPGDMLSLYDVDWATDVREVLPSVRVPTLVNHRMEDVDQGEPGGEARYFADRISGATLIELPGHRFWWQEDLAATIESFVAQLREEEEEFDRVLASILFTDIVGATERAAKIGDYAWRRVVEQHHALIRGLLVRFRGAEIDTAGDGFFATFDGPARAVRCALAIVDAVRTLGIDIRAGVHTGEVETINEKVGGMAVIIGARVAALAGPSEILVSQTVKDLTAGSGLSFEDAGEHELKGVPDRWRLYRVVA